MNIAPDPPEPRSRFFPFAVGAIVVLGVAWRLIGITEWPLRFYEALQYESAITARTIWLRIVPRALTPEEGTWVRDGHLRVTSPPILQTLTAFTYVAIGEEAPWVAAVWNTAFWLAGGWFVFRSATMLAKDRLAGLLALAWFLLAPGGIVITRSFQVESLLTLATAAATWSLLRPQLASARRDTLECAAICSLAAFVKPGVLFFPLFAGFAARLVARGGGWRSAVWHWLAFVLMVALPSVVHTTVVLGPAVAGRFMPALLIETPFVQNVAERITTMVGVTPALLGVVGTVWLAVRRQFVPLALFLGYLAYIPAFTWHTSIGHSYYHVHLIPLIAIGFSPLAASLIRRLPRQPLAGYSLGIVVVAIHLVITHYAFTGPWRWMPGTREFVDASRKEVLAEAETGREIGAITGPGASCIVLSKGLGLPLEYHAWVRTEWWPRWEEMVYIRYTFRQEKFDPVKFMEEMLVKHDPQYFVITDLVEFESHAYLRILLQRYFPKSIASNDRYRIYGR